MEEEGEERISHHLKGKMNELPTFNRILSEKLGKTSDECKAEHGD
jgi:demethoxyubiquinone hydroxylase (CLK1/Coq7/Cat5 family)